MSRNPDVLPQLERELKTLISTSSSRRVFLASLPWLLAACASVPQSRHREGDNSGQQAALTVYEEQRMTKEVLPEMRKDYPPVKSPELQSYISQLGQKVVTSNNLRGQPYHYNFTVVDVPFVNAFALPAGTVFVTAPLIEMAETEAELAGVVGHEIGHIQARHTAERMFRAQKEQKKSLLYLLGGGLVGGAVGYGLGQLVCAPRDKACLKKTTELGAMAGVGGGLLIQKYGFMAHSREDEMEADRIGFKTSVKAGYDRRYVGGFYAKLLKMEQEAKRRQAPVLAPLADAMSTHPPSRERVQQMQTMAAESPPHANAIESTQAFEKARQLSSQFAKRARDRQKSS